MRLSILADFHLGYPRFREDAVSQAARALSDAISSSDAVLLAGDLFDTRTPKPETLAEAFSLFRLPLCKRWAAKLVSFTARDGRAQNCSLPIIGIHGTHEMRAKSLANPIQLLEAAGLMANVHAATAVYEINGEKLAVTGLGGIPERQFSEAVKALGLQPVQGAFNIFMFHQTLRELIPQVPDDYPEVADLPEGFDLYACGHIHSPLIREIAGKQILIPGSTVLTQLRSEEQSHKGYYLYDTVSRKAEFREFETRPFKMFELDFNSASPTSIREECRKLLSSTVPSNGQKPIMRLKISGSLAPGFTSSDLDLGKIESEFSGTAFVFIDSHLASQDLRLKIEKIRELKQKGASVRDLGIDLLRESLRKKGFRLKLDPGSFIEIAGEKKTDYFTLLEELLASEYA